MNSRTYNALGNEKKNKLFFCIALVFFVTLCHETHQLERKRAESL